MTIELTILNFREYARQILNEHSEHLKVYNQNYLLHSKFSRLKFFNKHLKMLKEELINKIDVLLSEHVSQPYFTELEKSLHSTSIEYIDEYLSIGFNSSR